MKNMEKWKALFIINFLCLIYAKACIFTYGINNLMQIVEIINCVGVVVSYYSLAKGRNKVL